ncbi:MAG: glycerophosphoryl diester phosphodiesterase membrane domain-containing protein, partial [Candidatus Palauibacterales bacterium]|nr:glycerophosphoryl diester phosphodiesterase membrane domain-containing protein [Candidatus Palauibacterales bacterium]
MISLSRAVWRQFRAGFWRFFEFDVFFKILAAVVLQPISAWLASVLISSTGYPAFSNERIIAFLLSPVGVTTVIVSGTAAAAIIFTEFAGLVVLNADLSSSRPMTSAEALWRTIKKLPELAKLGMVVIVAFGLALAPFAALAALTYRALLSGADINYFLAETPPRFWAAVAIGLVLLIGAALVVAMLYIRWIFSVPALLFEAKGAVAALRKSSELVAGSMLKVGGVLLVWGGAIF